MEVLELRTYRDLQYVRSMETLMRNLDARLRAADGSLSAKSFQVGPLGSGQRSKKELGMLPIFLRVRLHLGRLRVGWDLGSSVGQMSKRGGETMGQRLGHVWVKGQG